MKTVTNLVSYYIPKFCAFIVSHTVNTYIVSMYSYYVYNNEYTVIFFSPLLYKLTHIVSLRTCLSFIQILMSVN